MEANKEKLAVSQGKVDIVRYLIQEEAKPDTPNCKIQAMSDIVQAWDSYCFLRPGCPSLYSSKTFFEIIRILLVAGGGFTIHNIVMWTYRREPHTMRHLLHYLLHHENSSLLISDIQTSVHLGYWLAFTKTKESAQEEETGWAEKSQLLGFWI